MVINGTIVMSLGMSCYPPNKQTYKKLIMRGFAGAFGVSALFYGLKLVPISEGVVLLKTTPLWTSLIVMFVMKTE